MTLAKLFMRLAVKDAMKTGNEAEILTIIDELMAKIDVLNELNKENEKVFSKLEEIHSRKH